MLQARRLVANIRGPWYRHHVVLTARSANERSAAVGPRQRQERTRIPGKGTDAQRGAIRGDGGRQIDVAGIFRDSAMTTTFSLYPEAPMQGDPKPRLWTADEYHRLHDLDFFLDQRVELMGGHV